MRGTARALALVLLGLAVVPGAPARAGVDRWTPLSSPLRSYVSHVVLDPERPSTLYAVSSGDDLWKSFDSGATWSLVEDGFDHDALFESDLRGPVFDPADSRRLWVWAEYALWFSADGGGHWTQRQGQLDPTPSLRQIVPDPSVPERLLALSAEGDVLASEDGGASWETMGHLDETPAQLQLSADPGAPGGFYAVGASGLLHSGDGGRTWSLRGTYHDTGFHELAIAPSAPDTLYAVPYYEPAELVRSDDGGRTWVVASPPAPRDQTANPLVDPVDARRVRVLVERGQEFFLLGSHDGGATWPDPVRAVSTRSEPGLFFPALVADPGDEAVLFATPVLQVSRDAGETWSLLGEEIPQGEVFSVAALPFAGRTLLLATTWDGSSSRLVRSGDGGSTWREMSGAPALQTLAADPHRPSRLWGLGLGVERSDDRGTTWRDVTPAGLLSPYDLLADPTRPRRVFVSTRFEGVWRTEDAGETWTQSVEGLPVTDVCHIWYCPVVGPMTVDSGAGDHVFVVVDGGLYRSRDGGDRWRRVGKGLPKIWTVLAHPSRAGVLFAGTIDGVYESDDGGAAWQRIPGLSADVRNLVFDPAGGRLYAAAVQGLFRWPQPLSNDWQSVDAGLPSISPYAGGLGSLVLDPSAPGRLFAAVPRLGVWTARFPGAEPLVLRTGRFELRAAFTDPSPKASSTRGFPTALSPESGSFAAVGCGSPHLLVRLIAGEGFVQLVAGGLTRRDAELTAIDHLSGVVRSYLLPASGSGTVVDASAFPAAPFTREAEEGAAEPGRLSSRAGACPGREVSIGRFCVGSVLDVGGGSRPAAGRRMPTSCGEVDRLAAVFGVESPLEGEVGVRVEGAPGGITVLYTVLTDRAWELTVTDPASGLRRTYSGGDGPASGVDPEAFPPP